MKKILKIYAIIAVSLLAIIVIFRKKIGQLLTRVHYNETTPQSSNPENNIFQNVKFKSNVNNPFNIRYNPVNKWEGKTTPPGAAFESFDTLTHGVRAGIKTLLTYFNKHKLNTIEDILYRWAPPSDGNNTEKYIRVAESKTGFSRKDKLTPSPETLFSLLSVFALMENSFELSKSLFNEAYEQV